MHRSSPRNSGKLSSPSPYARPEASKLKRSSSTSRFSTIRSVFSHVPNFFSRHSPTKAILPIHTNILDVAVEDDQKSVSGSEDNWDGQPPSIMQGQDVFDLARAAGQAGPAFDARVDEWRAKGEVPGGRRETARALQVTTLSTIEAGPSSPRMPGHLTAIKPSSSMPSLASSNSSLKRQRSPPPRTPEQEKGLRNLYGFLPPNLPPARILTPAEIKDAQASSISTSSTPLRPEATYVDVHALTTTDPSNTSAASAALAAFMSVKQTQPVTSDDFKVIETLTQRMRAEVITGGPSSEKEEIRLGGWAAGSYAPTPRDIRPYKSIKPESTAGSTPARHTPRSPLVPFLSDKAEPMPALRPGHVAYYGPGYSPRRMLKQSGSRLFEKPLFPVDADGEEEEPISKKRRVDSAAMADEQNVSTTGTPAKTDSATHGVFLPAKPLYASSSTLAVNGTAMKPSPLRQSTPASTSTSHRSEILAAAAKSSADILTSLIDSEEKEFEAYRKKTQPIIINPYDTNDREQSAISTPSKANSLNRLSRSSSSTPKLRSSLRGTGHLRGAAAKLAQHQSVRKLTTQERIEGKQSWQVDQDTPTRPNKAVTPSTPADEMEVDDLAGESPSRASPAPSSQHHADHQETTEESGTPKSSFRIPHSEPIEPFAIPTLHTPSLPIPPFKSTTSFSETFNSPSQDIFASAAPEAHKQQAVKFTPEAITPLAKPEDEPKLELQLVDRYTNIDKTDLKAIFLSAKDSALAISKEALPFYTFTLESTTKGDSEATKAAKDAVLGKESPVFKFELSAPDDEVSSPATIPAVAAPAVAGPWTCSLCMLSNPASAIEKCTICENPRG